MKYISAVAFTTHAHQSSEYLLSPHVYHPAANAHRLKKFHEASVAVFVATIWYFVQAVRLHGTFIRNSAVVVRALYVARGIVYVASIVQLGFHALSV